MATRKIVDKHINQSSGTYVGRTGEIFFDTATATLRLSDGTTAGGVIIDGTYVSSAHAVSPTTAIPYLSPYLDDGTISKNGLTIKITTSGIIQMAFDYAGNITGRKSVNGAAATTFNPPNPGATAAVGVFYDMTTLMSVGEHLVAVLVSSSQHKVWRVTVTMRDSEVGVYGAYAIIEQLQ
jgi:hypothetical protein